MNYNQNGAGEPNRARRHALRVENTRQRSRVSRTAGPWTYQGNVRKGRSQRPPLPFFVSLPRPPPPLPRVEPEVRVPFFPRSRSLAPFLAPVPSLRSSLRSSAPVPPLRSSTWPALAVGVPALFFPEGVPPGGLRLSLSPGGSRGRGEPKLLIKPSRSSPRRAPRPDTESGSHIPNLETELYAPPRPPPLAPSRTLQSSALKPRLRRGHAGFHSDQSVPPSLITITHSAKNIQSPYYSTESKRQMLFGPHIFHCMNVKLTNLQPQFSKHVN